MLKKKKKNVPGYVDDLAQRTAQMRRRLTIRKNIPLYIMIFLPLVFFLVFSYGPMFGLVMAFQNYRLKDGFFESQWVGWSNFKTIFTIPSMRGIIFNTLRIGILTVFVSFPFPIALAVMLNELRGKVFKKFSQTILYLPHFFSWVVLGGIVITFFSYAGPINSIIEALGGEKIGFLYEKGSWLGVYLGTGIWKEMGYDAIIYLAALTNIDPTFYEAAKVDGATKMQQITRITLPCLLPTITLQLILSVGKVASVGFDRIYVMTNAAVSDLTNIVSVFSYELGIRGGSYSVATAMGLFDSLLSLMLVLFTNWVAKKSDNELF